MSENLTDYGIKIEAHQTEHSDSNLLGHENGSIKSLDITKKKKDYQIAICQDGKFVVTFDMVNLRIKILQNTDYRPFYICEEKELDGTVEIDETIAYLKINNDFIIENENVYKPQGSELDINNSMDDENKMDVTFRWSIDISNIHKMNDDQYFVLVALSRINVDEDMKRTNEKNNDNNYDYKERYFIKKKFEFLPRKFNETTVDIPSESNNKSKKGIAIYRIELNKEIRENENEYYVFNRIGTCCYSNNHSVICRFVEVLNEDDSDDSKDLDPDDTVLKKFILLNFYGIYNFEFSDHYYSFRLSEKFEYPQSIKRKLNNWYADTDDGCMKRLLSSIYDKYFLVTKYKKDNQLLEVYNLANMELETTAKRFEKEDELFNFKKYNYIIFTITVVDYNFVLLKEIILLSRLYCMENGLQVASKKFNEMERIHLLEFIDSDETLLVIGEGSKEDKDPEGEKKLKIIIWDLYNTGKVEPIELDDFPMDIVRNIDTRLARTSGNILQIDNDGKVSSILKKIERILRQRKEKTEEEKNKHPEVCYPNPKPIIDVSDIEPWVLGEHERKTYYTLYHNKRGTEEEILQLFVGRSTVQIWHQVKDSKNKGDLPNNGKPFLEYIWTNRIPINQERDKTKLRIEYFKCGSNDRPHEKLNDFHLKVYWYERNIENNKKKDEDDEEIDKIEQKKIEINENKMVNRCDKVIKQEDISEKFRAVRHACKALEHLNKRCKNKSLIDNYIRSYKYRDMITYIELIVWKFAKLEPQNFRLLDIRHNIMKSLILSDCDDLIKYVLFGNEESIGNRVVHDELRHIPFNKSWPGRKFLKEDDLDFAEKNDYGSKNIIKPENNMELAIYHCKGREVKDMIVVAYFLEYYSRNAMDNAGWMCTVSKAIPLLFRYNYDDFVRKLFYKECFAGITQDSVEIIPKEYLTSHILNTELRAFGTVKLRSDKPFINKKFESKDEEKEEYNFKKNILNIFLLIFIPRWYKVGRNDKIILSPFSRTILHENDDIYDNPAIEAVISFQWQNAKNYFFSLFIRFLIYATCFGLVSWAYLDHSNIISQNFLLILIIVFYYLAIYQLITEVIEFRYRGIEKYCEIFNIFDTISIILAVTIMTIMLKNFQLSDGFGSAEDNIGLIVGISFSIFLLWIELILYLRLLPVIGIYIYHVIIIIKTIFPFFIFMAIVIFAFAHTMFVLLRNATDIKTKDSTFSGTATNSLTNEILDIKFKSDFDPTSSSDNPFTTFSRAIMTTYFWTSDNWVQRDQFYFWAVDLYTFIASIFLVIVLQNMLIAYMSGVYEEVTAKSRQILLKHRANFIAEYEALHHIHFSNPEPEPKFIYYLGQPRNFEEWSVAKKRNEGAIYDDFEENSVFIQRIFKERNYDKFSIWKYDDDNNIKERIENFKNIGNDMSDNIEYLIDKIKEIENMKIDLKSTVEKLNHELEKLKK
ncbi:hypothetical protein RhiirA4_469605 [Rhizophagus irregularis]|uniref:Ion transport domain-containing protein n=1 Tax=Rhizophagus irregularis TaxID=588596 RepID=A0A2I1GZU3_9GLOM|nr:hypothetical protein RhiirA4_469605 [Rhizophagus irregularis]